MADKIAARRLEREKKNASASVSFKGKDGVVPAVGSTPPPKKRRQ
jgi:hypothetical protein